MSAPIEKIGSASAAPIDDKAQLIEYLEQGSKPKGAWRIGTEHEKFAFRLDDLRPLPYDDDVGIRAILERLQRFGWDPVTEDGNVVALTSDAGGSITLEPGGQFELSGAPLETIHQTCDEVHQHLEQVKEVCQEIGAGMVGIGFNPKWRYEDMPWMPKGRYHIMRAYMPTRGALGPDMMVRTCTVQVNLDYENEADMVKKFRVGLALQPIATALFANSPFTEGKPNGFMSYRSRIWTDTDPDRCGMLPFVFEDGFGFERWVDYLLDVPMYFIHRGDAYLDVSGLSFRDFMAGEMPGHAGEFPQMHDWIDHMTTAFPEVRLKQYLEMRGADGGPWRRLCALPALWVGLLYDGSALDAAWDLCRDWSEEERANLREDVPRTALKTPFRSGTVRDIAVRMIEIAREGLRKRAVTDSFGEDECHFLSALDIIADSGDCPAETKLTAFHERWQGNIDELFAEYAY